MNFVAKLVSTVFFSGNRRFWLILMSLLGLIVPIESPLNLVVSGTSSGVAMAQDESVAPKKKKKKRKKKKKKKKGISEEVAPTESTEESASGEAGPESTTKRQKNNSKSFELLLNAGLTPMPMVGFGGTLGFFMGDGSHAIELGGTFGKKTDEFVNLGVMHAGVRYRKSFFSIPYVAVGLGFRSASAAWNNLGSLDGEPAELKTGLVSAGPAAEVAIGAQFILGSVAIGADIAAAVIPLGAKVKETRAEGDYDEEDYTLQAEKFNKYKGMNLMIMKVGIGLAL